MERAAGAVRARTLVTLSYWTGMLGDEPTAMALGEEAITSPPIRTSRSW